MGSTVYQLAAAEPTTGVSTLSSLHAPTHYRKHTTRVLVLPQLSCARSTYRFRRVTKKCRISPATKFRTTGKTTNHSTHISALNIPLTPLDQPGSKKPPDFLVRGFLYKC